MYLALTHFDEAVFAYQKALIVFKSSKGDNHPSVALVFVRLADLYYKKGKLRESRSYGENALRIYAKPVPGTSAEEIASGMAEISAIYEMPAFYRILKKKSVEQYLPMPYLATFLNCGLWVLKKRRWPVLILAAECLFMAVLALLVLTLAHLTKLHSAIVGNICMVGNIMMYASPSAVMKLVITTRSVDWTTYDVIRFDPFIIIVIFVMIKAPNGMGSLLDLAQLIIYATFFKSTQRMMAEKEAKSEVGKVEKASARNAQRSNADIQNSSVIEV
ncbi:bidirectional sugar transporter SWEET7-like [Olea europaea subsp. europaea]|uniref:Bidirectional sugar transporter SWEET7-like n=1 Tax=Olea europaea subsp. europaea TaxID=158383 RepID=A0A8S0PQH3_OLEEU|nr:bidirectional sugar transporter SWEET7-like [Olea europaea subsp. europaea]